jgi:hypothetical protein
MNLKAIQPIKYDDIHCGYNSDAKCPYCGHDNYVEAEDYGNEESQIDQCSNCYKWFLRSTNFSVDFSTEPLENYIVRELASKERQVERYEVWAEENKDTEHEQYYKTVLAIYKKQLESFIKEYSDYFECNEERD